MDTTEAVLKPSGYKRATIEELETLASQKKEEVDAILETSEDPAEALQKMILVNTPAVFYGYFDFCVMLSVVHKKPVNQYVSKNLMKKGSPRLVRSATKTISQLEGFVRKTLTLESKPLAGMPYAFEKWLELMSEQREEAPENVTELFNKLNPYLSNSAPSVDTAHLLPQNFAGDNLSAYAYEIGFQSKADEFLKILLNRYNLSDRQRSVSEDALLAKCSESELNNLILFINATTLLSSEKKEYALRIINIEINNRTV